MITLLGIAVIVAIAAGARVSVVGKWADEAMDKIMEKESTNKLNK
jgi:hypothetical protein